MIRVLIATDSVVVRAGLEAVVTSSPLLTVIGHAADLTTLSVQVESLEPDVILLELIQREEDALPSWLNSGPDPTDPAIVLLTEETPETWTLDLIQAGVRAILPREASATEIIAAIMGAAGGFVLFQTAIAETLLTPHRSPTRPDPRLPSQTLTPREVEVLEMLAVGLGNKTIAKRLQISEHTVKFHISSLFSKLNVSNRTEAVAIGARQGLIML